MATVQIKRGNLFDIPADMVVLPCNVQGGVAPFVLSALRHYALPEPPPIALGSIHVVSAIGIENIAQYAAFAASVLDGVVTTEQVIENIGQEIGSFCAKQNEISRISAPLLGAGAGGLQSERVVRALKRGFLLNAPAGASLTIFVLHEEIYDRIREDSEKARLAGAEKSSDSQFKRVFISYTGTSTQHNEWVVGIATYLRNNGIDARLDKWHLQHGMELPQWMTNELGLADKVLIVSDEQYKEKADGQIGGVGWETRIIQGDMLSLPPDNTKYVVIVRGEKFKSSIPRYLMAKYSIHWPPNGPSEEKHEEILRAVNESYVPPPINEVYTI